MSQPTFIYPTQSNVTEEILYNYNRVKSLTSSDLTLLLSSKPKHEDELLFKTAYDVTTASVGNITHLRAIIEFSNVCDADCSYCGIRKSASDVERFTLTNETIIKTAETAMKNYPGVLLQSGELQTEAFVSRLEDIVREIKKRAKVLSPLGEDFRIILSVGELSYDQLKRLKEAGADRFLLRIETSNKQLYQKVHDTKSSWEKREQCLKDMDALNYHVGTGVLIGLPGQTVFDLARDVLYYKKIGADMIGMGPMLIAKGTPMEKMWNEKQMLKDLHTDSLFDSVRRMVSASRLVMPRSNISATTAMEVLEPINGRILAIQSGANVVMPVLTPVDQKVKYKLYEGKSSVKSGLEVLSKQIEKAGRTMDLSISGDPLHWRDKQKW